MREKDRSFNQFCIYSWFRGVKQPPKRFEGFSLFYFGVDTLVLLKMVHWFHGPLAYRDLLPVRERERLVETRKPQTR